MASVWAGHLVLGSVWERGFTLSGPALAWCLMGYGMIAAALPVWLLLAPRDYLSTFMKIGTVAALGVAIIALFSRRCRCRP